MKVRAAEQTDVDSILQLVHESKLPVWSQASLSERVGTSYGFVLVVETELDSSLLGVAIARQVLDRLEIEAIGVAQNARRQGIGRLLHRALMRLAVPGRVELEVRKGNADARAFYSALGYAEEGIRCRYYQDGEDAILLSLVPDLESS